LRSKNIEVFYGDVQVIFDLSLKVGGRRGGEPLSAATAAGKSTLLRTISGPDAAGQGRDSPSRAVPLIIICPPKRSSSAGIVQVPEGRRLFTLMSVQDNLIVVLTASAPMGIRPTQPQ